MKKFELHINGNIYRVVSNITDKYTSTLRPINIVGLTAQLEANLGWRFFGESTSSIKLCEYDNVEEVLEQYPEWFI